MRTSQSVRLIGTLVLASTFMAAAAAPQADRLRPPIRRRRRPHPRRHRRGRDEAGRRAPAVVFTRSPRPTAGSRSDHAPQAQAVLVSGGDIPDLGQNGVMTKGENGVWTFTSAPVRPELPVQHQCRGVAVIDPRNPLTSVSNSNVWSPRARPRIRPLRTPRKCPTGQWPPSRTTRRRSNGTGRCTFTRRRATNPTPQIAGFYLLPERAIPTRRGPRSAARDILDNLLAARKAQR